VHANIGAGIDVAALQPVGSEHATGFMRLLPSTWRIRTAVATRGDPAELGIGHRQAGERTAPRLPSH
jgi:hypothetical protein